MNDRERENQIRAALINSTEAMEAYHSNAEFRAWVNLTAPAIVRVADVVMEEAAGQQRTRDILARGLMHLADSVVAAGQIEQEDPFNPSSLPEDLGPPIDIESERSRARE